MFIFTGKVLKTWLILRLNVGGLDVIFLCYLLSKLNQ